MEPQNGNFIRRHAQAVARSAKVAVLHVISDPASKSITIDASWKKDLFEVIVYTPKYKSWQFYQKYQQYLHAHRLGYEKILETFGSIDIIHLNVLYRAGLFALELKRKYRIPFIVTEHSTAFLKINDDQFKLHEKYLIRKIAAAAAYICPVSEDLRLALERFGIDGPYAIIPNVVDTNIFQYKSARPTEKVRLLHVSTLSEKHKNFSGMLRVIKRLSVLRNDFSMSFIGNNFGAENIKKVRALGLDSNLVSIREEVPIAEIAAEMDTHHIFILFSNYENLPCVISEAHAAGMIVIATDVGGVNEMIDEQNGLLVPAKDEEALLQAINQVIDRLHSFDAAAVSTKARARYSYESVGRQYLALYHKVLAKS